MTLGAENKRAVKWLCVLGVVLAGVIYYNFFVDSPPSNTSTPARKAASGQPDLASSDEVSAPRSSRGRVEAFLPALHKKHGDKAEPPPSDPTLRLDLLAKLNEVPPAGGGRDLFNFGKAEPVKLAGTEPIVKVQPWAPIGPPRYTPPQPKAAPAPPPPPPPINLKYYCIYTTRADGQRTAFFMDGDDILIAAEGSTFKGRYRLVRIGVNSAVVLDLQYKHEQTIPLAEDAAGAGE
jgi:hypothetical protein